MFKCVPENPNEPISLSFLALKAFFLHKVAFFVSRIPCTLKWAAVLFIWTYFERCGETAKPFLGGISKVPKNPFFRHFFGPKGNCMLSFLPFSLFAHLFQSKWRLSCEFERNRSCRVKVWEWKMTWNFAEPKSTRTNLEKLAKVKK